jgi:peptidoglycan/LPS O-acetylase OafA/YrhL
MSRPVRPPSHILGLDSIRFVCALWVFFYHQAAPPLPFTEGTTLGFLAHAFFGNLWCGPAAVIVFFIISGFCIHTPFADRDRPPRLAQFYSRRFLRLLPPMLAAMLFAHWVGVDLGLLHVSVLWSLVAEFIYYLLYPVVRLARFVCGGWCVLIVLAYLAAFGLVLTRPAAGDYPAFGLAFNWLLGLPCWLLGCALAEKFRVASAGSILRSAIWLGRAALLVLVVTCSFLRFHGFFGVTLGFPWTLNLFALPAAAWLSAEIVFHQSAPPLRILEWAGLWSYSLYLVHIPATALFNQLFPANPGLFLHWLALVLFVLALSYGFYLLVERPSHGLARRISQRFAPPSSAKLPAS